MARKIRVTKAKKTKNEDGSLDITFKISNAKITGRKFTELKNEIHRITLEILNPVVEEDKS